MVRILQIQELQETQGKQLQVLLDIGALLGSIFKPAVLLQNILIFVKEAKRNKEASG